MFPIIGIVVVFGAVVAGYLLEKGNLMVLMQPAELVIIGGAALGTLLIGNPPTVLGHIIKGILGAFKSPKFGRGWYLESLRLIYGLCDTARRAGLPALEAEIEEPEKGKIFSNHPDILRDHYLTAFICDSFRMITMGDIDPYALDQVLEADMDVHHHEAVEPIGALTSMAESLPGLGIVAAVLGVVITMGSLGGRPEEIGHKVAAALVGTFLGILLCYGLVSPLAAIMTKHAEAERRYLSVLRTCIAAFSKGLTPLLAIESGRRSIPEHLRPSFQEVEETCRKKASEAQAAA